VGARSEQLYSATIAGPLCLLCLAHHPYRYPPEKNLLFWSIV